METNDHHKEKEILEQYKMKPTETKSVKAWSKEYGIEDILNSYLEKSGYPVKEKG